MVDKTYTEFLPSHRRPPDPKYVHAGAVPANELFQVSVYLKPRGGADALPGAMDQRAQLHSQRSVEHAADFELIQDFAREHGLSAVSVEPAKRLVKLSGTAAQFQSAFRTSLYRCSDGKKTFRARSGSLQLPVDLLPIVESVLGLDTRPVAKPRVVVRPATAAGSSYLPSKVASLYGFPTSVSGQGECIALIELGGGFNPSDTATAFRSMGLESPTVVAVSVDGGKNTPSPDDGADAEVTLDIQVAGGGAPGAKIAVYFAPNTDAGFIDAITSAAQDASNRPSVMSISWGSAESQWTQQSIQSMNSALQDASRVNVSVFVAAGDNLATDAVNDARAHVDFPASSPYAIGCGGTAITASGNSVTNETVWNDGNSGTGGGISDLFPVPAFQENATLPPSVNDGQRRRGVPDVAGDAAPGSGYQIVVSGQQQVVGGTSAVAPLWAGLTALINQAAGAPVGFILPRLYGNPSLLRQITHGNNIPSRSALGYQAGPGWNACTGLGVPNGPALFAALTSPATNIGSPS